MHSLLKVFKVIVPLGLVQYFRLLRLRIKFWNSEINSPNVSINADIKDHVKIALDCEVCGSVSVGHYSYIEPYTTVNVAKIGSFCSIGRYVSIGVWEHPLNMVTTSPRVLREVLNEGSQYNDSPTPTVIGNDVWIGNNAVVLGGIVVGDGAVIAAGAVVTKDVPPYGVVAGVPAKLIRYRMSLDASNRIERDNWFCWNDKQIKSHRDYFINPVD